MRSLSGSAFVSGGLSKTKEGLGGQAEIERKYEQEVTQDSLCKQLERKSICSKCLPSLTECRMQESVAFPSEDG